MSQENRLEKTNRINLLFAFYERLLTDKQQTFLKYYFHDDFSLGRSQRNLKLAARLCTSISSGRSKCLIIMKRSLDSCPSMKNVTNT